MGSGKEAGGKQAHRPADDAEAAVDDDPVERRLMELSDELDAEKRKAEAAFAQATGAVRRKPRRPEAAPKAAPPEGEEEGESGAEAEPEIEVQVEVDAQGGAAAEVVEAEAEPEPAAAGSVARAKARIKKEADAALGEVVAGALQGKGVSETALEVASRRLPPAPTRQRARNALLALGGAAVVGYASWWILAPVLSFLWSVTKIGILGGVLYGGYWVYSKLPDEGTAKDGKPAAGKDDEPDDAD